MDDNARGVPGPGTHQAFAPTSDVDSGLPVLAGSAPAIEYGDELVDAPTWETLKAKPRQVMESLGLDPPRDVEESFVCYDDDNRTVAWWADAGTGSIAIYFRRSNIARRYRPSDPEVVVRRAAGLPAVPVAALGGTAAQEPGGASHGARWADRWFASALWRNLPDKVQGHLVGAVDQNRFTGRDMAIRRWFTAEQRAEETIYTSIWDEMALAGAWCRRVGFGACPDEESAAQLLAGRPWQCIVFRVPLTVRGDSPALLAAPDVSAIRAAGASR